MRSSRTLTHRSAASSILIAHCPIALTAFLTKSTSTSDAYLRPPSVPIRVEDEIGNSLLQFTQKRIDVLLRCELDHNLELLHLDVGWIIVLAEEDAHLVREGFGTLLEDEVDVAQGDPLHFWGRRDERYCGMSSVRVRTERGGDRPRGGPILRMIPCTNSSLSTPRI